MESVTVLIHAGDHGDVEEADRLTRQLRQELLALDVNSVTLDSTGTSPAGAKGDSVTVGALIITLANSTVLVSICQLVRSWVRRGRDRRIVIKDGERSLELSSGSPEQHQQLIEAFLTVALNQTQPEDPA